MHQYVGKEWIGGLGTDKNTFYKEFRGGQPINIPFGLTEKTLCEMIYEYD